MGPYHGGVHFLITSVLGHISQGIDFNQTLDRVKWPSNLESLTFGAEFNKCVDDLPSSLSTLTFGAEFNQHIEVELPKVQSLTLGRTGMLVTSVSLLVKHGADNSPVDGGFDGKIICKWWIFHCHI